jgi:hypothetical protein
MENHSDISNFVTPLTNITIPVDYFEGVYSSKSLSPAIVFIYVIGLLIGVLGPITIIWYERNCDNRFRTILNQMFARVAWYLLACTLFIFIPEGVRFLYGPFDELYCDFHVVMRNILWVGLMLTLDCILILRYAFIFTWKNFAVISDDVLAKLFNLSILLVAIWAAFVKRITPGNLPLNYYLCCGIDPNGGFPEGHFLDTPQKYNTGRIIVCITFLLHLITIPRILYYQLVTMRQEQPLQLGVLNSEGSSNTAESQRPSRRTQKTIRSLNNSKTIMDVATQIMFLVFVVILGVFVTISEKVEPKKYNLDTHKYIPLSVQIYCPVFAYIAIHAVLFIQNAAMRQTIWRKIKINCKNDHVGIEE